MSDETRATSYIMSPFTAFDPCDDCGGPLRWWSELPCVEHNLAALYECGHCGAVFTLADVVGGMIEFLPVGVEP